LSIDKGHEQRFWLLKSSPENMFQTAFVSVVKMIADPDEAI